MGNVKNIATEYNILLSLLEGEKRFSQLLKEAKKASLAKELNELQKLRYVERIVDEKAKPPTTTYKITKTGKEFLRNNAEFHLTKIELHLQRLKQLMPNRIRELRKNL